MWRSTQETTAVLDARDKLIGLIRHAVEDEAGASLVATPGTPTRRGGYETTLMIARNGTATALTIEVAWYPDSARFTLSGPAVQLAGEAFWAARGLHLRRKHGSYGPLQCSLLVPYADGDRASRLLAVLPALAAPGLNSYKFDVLAVTTINVRALTEEQARAMIGGLDSITTRTAGDGIEAAGLNVTTGDYDVVNVCPRGPGYLVGAETRDGKEVSVTALEIIPESVLPAAWAALEAELAEADLALAGDSNDDEHDALNGLAEAVRRLLDRSGHPRAATSSPAPAPGLDFPHGPTASTLARPARAAAPGTTSPPPAQRPRRAGGR
jgi:hypothetical protein